MAVQVGLILAVSLLLIALTSFLVRRVQWTFTVLFLAVATVGSAVALSMRFGVAWSVVSLSLAFLAATVFVLLLAISQRSRRKRELLTWTRSDLLGVIAPTIALILGLLATRAAAPRGVPLLSNVGYLMNHGLAEDNAKWLSITAPLATGESFTLVDFDGGALLMMLSFATAAVMVISTFVLGGINEVAVASSTLIVTQFALIAAVPLALSPLANGTLRPKSGTNSDRYPPQLLWAGAIVLVCVSAISTAYGHLSFQFAVIVVTLWFATFLNPSSSVILKVASSLLLGITATVWFPLTPLAVAVLLGTIVFTTRRKSWGLTGLTALVSLLLAPAFVSSMAYVLGIDISLDASRAAVSESSSGGSAVLNVPSEVLASSQLFEAPGGTEVVQPILGTLAVLCFLICVSRGSTSSSDPIGLRAFGPVTPIFAMLSFVLIVFVADSLLTADAPNYGSNKIMFLWVSAALASTLPPAIAYVTSGERRMTLLRWSTIVGVVALLTIDTILPRALSALSPQLWEAIDASNPQYWSPAEAREVADQPLSAAPVACLFAPPESSVPTSLPLGAQSYSCTRLLMSLANLGHSPAAGAVTSWLQTDWLSGEMTWDARYDDLLTSTKDLDGRTVILMSDDYGVNGLETWDTLASRNAPTAISD